MPKTAETPAQAAPGRTFLRLKAVLAKTGLAPSSLYDSIAKGAFPAPVPLSKRRAAWLSDEIESWMQTRVAARDAGAKTVPVKRRRLSRERGNA
jgi:prophage regulatory protein